MGTASKIAEIVAQRNNSVEPLLKEEEKCLVTQTILDHLQSDLTKFIRNKKADNPTVQNCSRLLENIPRIKQRISNLRENINHCRRRFDRPTINIGFGGKRGQGKSFLLQKFSGLTDNEVPSGSGKTVTAVRSEIFNHTDAYAEILFYTPHEFLNEVIRPYCEQLHIQVPTTLEEFSSLCLPDPSEVNDLQVSYLVKLSELHKHLSEYSPLLTGETKIERDFCQLRKFVAYTDQNSNDTFYYAAVKRVLIHTPFPEIQVKQLGLVDLPGLGELNPTVETRHTAGFGDEVDMVLLIRRPFGTRVDWDKEDQNAMETLKSAIKDGDLPGFVVIVQNEGGCDAAMANTALQCITNSVSNKFIVLRSSGDNSQVLTKDVLTPVLDHLAQTLPQKDQKALREVHNLGQILWKDIAEYSKKALEILKKLNDRGFPEEEMQLKAQENREQLARNLEDAAKLLDEKIKNNDENEELIESVEQIQQSLKDFIASGLGAGSIEEWIRINANKIATSKNVNSVYTDNANILRVQIAEEFTALNHVYNNIIEELLTLIAKQLEDVLPNFMQGENGREKLLWLRQRLVGEERNFDNIVDALDFLLEFKIEHRTQIYPRAYEPIRQFMSLVENLTPPPDIIGKGRDEQAAAVFDDLSGNARQIIMNVGDLLINEALRINDILYVALQFFDDKIIRSQNAALHWERFIKAFYPEIYGSKDDASTSMAIGAIMEKLARLNNSLQ